MAIDGPHRVAELGQLGAFQRAAGGQVDAQRIDLLTVDKDFIMEMRPRRPAVVPT